MYRHYCEPLSFISEPIRNSMTLTALSITPSFTELAIFGIPPRYHSDPFSRHRRRRRLALATAINDNGELAYLGQVHSPMGAFQM